MAKIIRLTPELVERLRAEFEDAVKNMRLSDGKFSFERSITAEKQEATVFFTEKAWLKMWALINKYDKEVAWHGIARRGDDESKNEYIISDILIYPQKVTGATVETDHAEYQSWLLSQGPAVMSTIRMQGHSHVNMSTSPSTVDTGYYKEIIDQLSNTMFYIFMIWNKRGEKTIVIYDMAKNIMFQSSDVKVELIEGDIGVSKLLAEADKMVRSNVYTYQSTVKTTANDPKPAVPAKKEEKKPEPEKKDEKPDKEQEKKSADPVAASDSKNKVRKGRRKEKESRYPRSAAYGLAGFDEDYDDDDDPYGPFGYREHYGWR